MGMLMLSVNSVDQNFDIKFLWFLNKLYYIIMINLRR